MVTFSNAVETVAGSDYPGIGGWTPQVFAEIFEYGRRFRRERSEIVDCLVGSGCETGGRNVVPQNSLIDDLGEKGRLRNELAHQMRNIFLSFGRKRLLVPCTAAKSDDDNLSFLQDGTC